MVVLRNIYAKELAAIRAIEAETGEANRGINLLWWGSLLVGSAMVWTAIIIAFA